MGVLSAIPILNLGNACCCLWVICGGVVAAYLLQQDQAEPIAAGDGALVGLFAGLFGTLVTVLLSIPINLMMAPLQRQFLERMNQNGQMPRGFEDLASSAAVGVIGTVFLAMVFLVAGVIFSTLGGLLGAAIFKKPARPAAGDTSLQRRFGPIARLCAVCPLTQNCHRSEKSSVCCQSPRRRALPARAARSVCMLVLASSVALLEGAAAAAAVS